MCKSQNRDDDYFLLDFSKLKIDLMKWRFDFEMSQKLTAHDQTSRHISYT